MADKTRQRERETEAETSDIRLHEPKQYEYELNELDRAAHGQIIVRADERVWDVHRQATSKHYLSPHDPDLRETAWQQWDVFIARFAERSGKQRQQGGLAIFILEGEGHSIVAGASHPWKRGDLLMLPIVAGGVEHQHFNHHPDRPAKWIAFAYRPFYDYAGNQITQLEPSPEFASDASD